jgi:hypothetical protein
MFRFFLALLSHEVSPKPSLTEVKAAYSSVVKYVRDGLLISEDMLGNSILRELLHIFVSDEKNLAVSLSLILYSFLEHSGLCGIFTVSD